MVTGGPLASESPPGHSRGRPGCVTRSLPGQCPDKWHRVAALRGASGSGGGTALGLGAAGLTCGNSGPQHSPPQPPSSPLPTGAAWSRGPSQSWARPEGERTQGEGWGRRHVGMRSPGASRQARGKSSPRPGHALCSADARSPQVCWAPLGIPGR